MLTISTPSFSQIHPTHPNFMAFLFCAAHVLTGVELTYPGHTLKEN